MIFAKHATTQSEETMNTPDPRISRALNVLLDRYVEICNHYSEQLGRAEAKMDNSNRLSLLIQNMEQIQLSAGEPIAVMQDGSSLGQNIVPTQDTLDALAAYRDDLLTRLKAPEQELPRNIADLTKWLRHDVRQIVSAFPSFTYAWDKLVELGRLTAVTDSRQLLARDTVCMATIELCQFVRELGRLLSGSTATPPAADDGLSEQHSVLSLDTSLLATIDTKYAQRFQRVKELIESQGSHIDEAARSNALHQVIALARRDLDLLAIFGLELGFAHWLQLSDSRVHRKIATKSLIYFSKILLAEKVWSRAVDFAEVAIAMTRQANVRAKLSADEGIAMLTCNRFWALHCLGFDIAPEVSAWNTTALHPRYAFLQYVLLRRYGEAIAILENLTLRTREEGAANLSLAEVNEWPILEDFRRSQLYQDWSAKRK